MHEYTCNNIDSGCTGHFTTDFAPIYDPPAHCPRCGNDTYVMYVGEQKAKQYFDAMQKIVESLGKCRYQSGGYSLSDLDRWLETEFSKMADLIHDARMTIEGGEVNAY